jgi:hypothetical protein
MGDQCVNIAKLIPLSGNEPPKDKDILDAIERMGRLTRSLVSGRPKSPSLSETCLPPRISSVKTPRSTG